MSLTPTRRCLSCRRETPITHWYIKLFSPLSGNFNNYFHNHQSKPSILNWLLVLKIDLNAEGHGLQKILQCGCSDFLCSLALRTVLWVLVTWRKTRQRAPLTSVVFIGDKHRHWENPFLLPSFLFVRECRIYTIDQVRKESMFICGFIFLNIHSFAASALRAR